MQSIPLDHLEVTMLESQIQAAGLTLAVSCEHFGIVRIVQLPAAKLDEARAWILGQKRPAAAA